MSTETPDPELTALAANLAALKPAAGRLDRDQLMYRAGHASSGRRHWLWPGATAVLAVLAAALGLLALWPRPPQRIEYIVVVRPEPVPPVAAAAGQEPTIAEQEVPLASEERERRLDPLSCYQLERLVSRWGVKALPQLSAAGAGPAATSEQLLSPGSTTQFLETLTP